MNDSPTFKFACLGFFIIFRYLKATTDKDNLENVSNINTFLYYENKDRVFNPCHYTLLINETNSIKNNSF
jgi:hypothetical protein